MNITKAPQKKSSTKTLLFLGIFFLVLGIGLNKISHLILDDVNSAKTWPSVMGKVEGSVVYKNGESDSGNPMYSYEIQVSYIVENQSYSTKRVTFGGTMRTTSKRSVQKKVDAYSKGSSVPVYYNPEDPGDSVLETKLPLSLLLISKLPYVSILLGLYLLVRGVIKLLMMISTLGLAATTLNNKTTDNTSSSNVSESKDFASATEPEEFVKTITPVDKSIDKPKKDAEAVDNLENDGFSI